MLQTRNGKRTAQAALKIACDLVDEGMRTEEEDVYKMQTTAVIRAAIKVKNAHPDWAIKPEIMIPLVGDIKELKYVKKFVVETADAEIKACLLYTSRCV